MDLQSYLRILRKNWWLILIAAVLGTGGGVLINVEATPMYASSVTFYVSTPSDAAGGNAYTANQYALAKIESYTQLMTSERLAQMIIARTGLPMSVGAVQGEISAASDLNTVLLTATVTDASPTRSLAIASAIATDFGTMVDQLDNRTSKDGVAGSTVVLNVTSGPTLKSAPVSPKKTTNIALGLIAGLAMGVGLALLRGLLDTSVRSLDLLREVSGLPVVGAVAYDSAAKKTPILIGDQARSIRAESFRQLRTNLQFMNVDNPVQVLVVTSSVANEGKSTTATNLAIVYAETGRRVLLIEADMRRPRVADYLGLERAVGLSNVLAGQVEFADVLQPWGTDGLVVLPSGSIPPNPSELLGSQNMIDLVGELRNWFDTIIIDTPPLLPVTDAVVAATWADGVILVVRYGKTTRTQIATAVRSLHAVDARILGSVLTMRPNKGADAAGGYDGYGYHEDDPSKGPPADVPAVVPVAPSVVLERNPRAAVQSVAADHVQGVDAAAVELAPTNGAAGKGRLVNGGGSLAGVDTGEHL